MSKMGQYYLDHVEPEEAGALMQMFIYAFPGLHPECMEPVNAQDILEFMDGTMILSHACHGHKLAKPAEKKERHMYHGVNAIKKANAAVGHHFFSKDTMKHTKCRVAPGVLYGCVFVTSEKRDSPTQRLARRWTVRYIDERCHIQLLGVEGQFANLYHARKAQRFWADGFRRVDETDADPAILTDSKLAEAEANGN